MGLNYVEFLREAGPHFSVNNMLRARCHKRRMKKGLGFLKLNYMIMQNYDFYKPFRWYGCNMQFGGDDQWSNMLDGTELIRHRLDKDVYVATITLLLNSGGKKIGKMQPDVAWLDPEETPPFGFYQHWRNVGDPDVLKCLCILTFLSLEQIDEMGKWGGSQLNQAGEILVFELIKLVHGEEEVSKAQKGARTLFVARAGIENVPAFELTEEDFSGGTIDILSIPNRSGLVAFRSEAGRDVKRGDVSVDGNLVRDTKTVYSRGQLGDGMIVKCDKKSFKKTVLK